MPRKMPKSLHSWLIPKLRHLSRYWVGKTIARDNAKVYIEIGTFKNGKPKMSPRYRCAECDRQGIKKLYEEHETQMDHIKPVVDIKGFNNWDDYVKGLFCEPSNYQCLCTMHHDEKTKKENLYRKKEKIKRNRNKRLTSDKK